LFPHRLLVHRIKETCWVCLDPEENICVHDLTLDEHFLWDCYRDIAEKVNEPLFFFEPVSEAVIDRFYDLSRRNALRMDTCARAIVCDKVWVFADPNHTSFGHLVPADAPNVDPRFVAVHTNGMAVDDTGAYVPIRLVFSGSRAKIVLQLWRETSDVRSINLYVNATGRRHIKFREILGKFKKIDLSRDFSFEGPLATTEFLDYIGDNTGKLLRHDADWHRLSGVSPTSSLAHEHRNIGEATLLAMAVDQLVLSSLEFPDALLRQLVQVEIVVERNPMHPDYKSFGALVEDNAILSADDRTHQFFDWVREQQRQRADILHQDRLYGDAMRHGGRSSGSENTDASAFEIWQ
jgi:hypothetical protein